MAARACPAGLTAGAARVDITPPLTVPHLGFAGRRHAFFQGVHDPLHARAVVVSDGRERVAIVSADLIGFRRTVLGPGADFTDIVRQRAHRLCGMAPDRVMLAATHAHSTPETLGFRPLVQHPGAREWLETLADQLATAVALADRDRGPVRLKRIVGSAETIGKSRRNITTDGRVCSLVTMKPDDEIACWGADDHAVTVLVLETPDGRPRTALVHFTCHPTTVQVNPLVSADFPGAAMTWIERAGVGCDCCLFLQGACGSINPVRGTSDFGDVARYGQILGGEVVKLLGAASAPDWPVEAPAVGCARQTVSVESRALPQRQALEQELDALRETAAHGADPAERRRAQQATGMLEEQLERVLLGAGPFDAEVQVMRLAETALVGVPVEPFCELGLAIRHTEHAPCGLCVGYANDYLGYVGPAEAWPEGGYEFSLGMWSILGPAAQETLIATSTGMMAKLFAADDSPSQPAASLRTGAGSP